MYEFEFSAVIPNFNGLEYLETLLPSLNKIDSLQIVVADGGSTDGSIDFALQHGARIVPVPGNPGFAAACNSGVAMSSGRFVWILNNDVAVNDPAAPFKLREALDHADLVGSAGCWFTPDFGCAGETQESVDVDYIPLWSAMLSRRTWDEMGGLDEVFGMGYSEDADLAIRLRRKGFSLQVVPDSGVVHVGGGGKTATQKMGLKFDDLHRHCQRNIELLKQKNRLPRILVIRLDAIGDVLMTATVVKQLRREYPHAQIFWYVKPQCADAVRMSEVADQILVTGDPFAEMILETQEFDLLFNFNDYPLDKVVRLRQRGQRVYGSYFIGEQYVNRTWRTAGVLTTQRRFHAMVAGIELESEIPPVALRYIAAPVKLDVPMDKPLIAMHCGTGGGNAKAIPKELSFELVNRLNQRGFRVMMLGAGSKAEDRQKARMEGKWTWEDDAAEHCAGCDILDFVGQTTLLELPALLARCELFLGTDSAIRHIAVGCGIKTVCMFTLADHRSCGSYPGHVDLQSKVPCSPCIDRAEEFMCPNLGWSHLMCWKHMNPEQIVQIAVNAVPKG